MIKESFSILVVDDEFSVRDSLCSWFRKDGYDVAAAVDGQDALAHFQKHSWDVVLLDIRMPGIDGLEVQRRLQRLAPDTVVVMLTAHGTIDSAVEAMKNGAFDYITKPADPDELTRVIHEALQHQSTRRQNDQLQQKLDELSESDEIIGDSPPMRRVDEMVRTLAQNDVTVLIRGESGTGKELVARAIHANGPRRYFSMVPVNCGALAETLLESELFGHEKGAFTGAQTRRKGKIEMAAGGTLFLDEIACVSPKMQVELLRVLDSKEVVRIGGSKPIKVDFRVVCATNQDLEQMVERGEFRQDLYFRINVFQIDLPPLRERREDIPLLAKHFVETMAARMGKNVTGLSTEAIRRLKAHDWPGNVRELANAIERAMVLSRGPYIQPEQVMLGGERHDAGEDGTALADVEKHHIAQVLESLDWNISKAARALGIDRATLYNKIKKYQLRT